MAGPLVVWYCSLVLFNMLFMFRNLKELLNAQVPEEGIGGVNEKCFNEGHLKFGSDQTRIYKKINGAEDYWDYEMTKWRATKAVRTSVGTYPPGSEWAKIDLPDAPATGVVSYAFMDLVQVPAGLELGKYVLSFRWDTQQGPQVWNSCANVEIMEASNNV